LLQLKSTRRSDCSSSTFPESLLALLDIPLYHGLMCGNTYKLLVEVDIPMNNVRLLKIMTCDSSSTTSETSSGSSSSSVAYSITSQHVILWFLTILHNIVLGLCQVVLRLHVIIGFLCKIVWLLRSVVWSLGLIELRHCFPSHHFGLYPICI
jgi:hypothetical protein